MTHIIVFGNEKGGTGKSTLAMHVVVHLLRKHRSVAVLDLDSRQRSVSRFLENRAAYAARNSLDLPQPRWLSPEPSKLRSAMADREREEQTRLQAALEELKSGQDFLAIDCPGGHTHFAQLAHALADTLVTPLNDSFVDLDLLGQVSDETFEVTRLSHYAEMVWNSRKFRSAGELPPMDWVVTPNRVGSLQSRNNQRVDQVLDALRARLMFRFERGLTERVIFRELFVSGLTLMDLAEIPGKGLTQMSHLAAREEVRRLVDSLNLPMP
ncbi:MAG: division plane positioning ATPase MipZ [Pseudomonadota bacterium]